MCRPSSNPVPRKLHTCFSMTRNERALQMTDQDWAIVFRECALSMRAQNKDTVLAQNAAELSGPPSAKAGSSQTFVFAVSCGAVSLERRTDDGVTRFGSYAPGPGERAACLDRIRDSVPNCHWGGEVLPLSAWLPHAPSIS